LSSRRLFTSHCKSRSKPNVLQNSSSSVSKNIFVPSINKYINELKTPRGIVGVSDESQLKLRSEKKDQISWVTLDFEDDRGIPPQIYQD
jgi:hypothetical protein